jgi:hypothetical protein
MMPPRCAGRPGADNAICERDLGFSHAAEGRLPEEQFSQLTQLLASAGVTNLNVPAR